MSKDQKKDERIYVGKGVKARGGYDIINISLAKSKLESHWYEYNGDEYIKLTVGAKKETDKYGKTHTVWVNNWKPEGESKPAPKVEKAPLEDDMPF